MQPAVGTRHAVRRTAGGEIDHRGIGAAEAEAVLAAPAVDDVGAALAGEAVVELVAGEVVGVLRADDRGRRADADAAHHAEVVQVGRAGDQLEQLLDAAEAVAFDRFRAAVYQGRVELAEQRH